jgi:hypothetical protein
LTGITLPPLPPELVPPVLLPLPPVPPLAVFVELAVFESPHPLRVTAKSRIETPKIARIYDSPPLFSLEQCARVNQCRADPLLAALLPLTEGG